METVSTALLEEPIDLILFNGDVDAFNHRLKSIAQASNIAKVKVFNKAQTLIHQADNNTENLCFFGFLNCTYETSLIPLSASDKTTDGVVRGFMKLHLDTSSELESEVYHLAIMFFIFYLILMLALKTFKETKSQFLEALTEINRHIATSKKYSEANVSSDSACSVSTIKSELTEIVKQASEAEKLTYDFYKKNQQLVTFLDFELSDIERELKNGNQPQTVSSQRIKDLNAYLRSVNRTGIKKKESFSLNSLICELLKDQKDSGKRKNCDISLIYTAGEESLNVIQGDYATTRLVLSALFDNAFRFSKPNSGVNVIVTQINKTDTTVEHKIEICNQAESGDIYNLETSVKSLSNNDIPRGLFGDQVGIAMSSRLVGELEGALSVKTNDSKVCVSLELTFDLYSRGNQLITSAKSPLPAINMGKSKILFISDASQEATAIHSALFLSDMDVDFISSPDNLLIQFSKSVYDVILINTVSTNKKYSEIIGILRTFEQKSRFIRTPVIALVNSNDVIKDEELFDELIKKPTGPMFVVETIKEWSEKTIVV